VRGRAIVDLLLAGEGAIGVETLAARAGMSPRQVHRLCLEAAGLGPKRLARIVRFQRALRSLTARRGPALAALALDAGYCDQAHLTREVRRLVGTTPGALRTAAPPSETSKTAARPGR
jgi:AraC-like DNA-binding protein